MWGYFKEDLKDSIDYNRSLKNSDYDTNGITEIIAHRFLYQMEIYEEHIGEKPTITDYKLRGWDWGELCDKFDLEDYEPPKDSQSYAYLNVDDVLEHNKVLHYLQDNWRDNKEVVDVIREHLRAMMDDCDEHTHYDAVWEGMLNIESDEVFMQFVFALLGHMWT